MSQPDGCPPGGTESARAGAKSVLILPFISTIFHVPLCATQSKLWSAYDLKVSFLCQVFLLQSLCTETPFSSWHLEKSFLRLLSAKSVCVEEARGLDRFIFFSLWSHAYRLPSQRALQAWRTLQRLHFPFLLLFLGWGVLAEGKSIIHCSAYVLWGALAQTDSFQSPSGGRVQPPLHGFILFYDQNWSSWPVLGNAPQYWNLHNCKRFPVDFAFQVFIMWHSFLKLTQNDAFFQNSLLFL